MQMISSRAIDFIDAQSLTSGEALEVLFRDGDGCFLLYLSDGECASAAQERVLLLDLREALIWLNEPAQEQGSFWE
ncbi:hypothetical protein [Bradyrhizobium sp. dw_411]|uniref:hypothetical protein n=1 Tax=Bradyrhizobium sp. dw_411 TaxID=2720082 RepID=UPI001BCD9644|nr:hypothetical protein [Bradyrhizobium sp. dw_411]